MQSERTAFQSPACLELSTSILYIAANRSVSASVSLTAIAEALQESKCYISTDARSRQRRNAESGSVSYGYEATFLAALEQRAEIVISFYKMILDIRSAFSRSAS